MTILETNVIDTISIENNTCILTIADHLEWTDNTHLILLQNKINSYIHYIESEHLYTHTSPNDYSSISIQLIYKFSPPSKEKNILLLFQEKLNELGIEFTYGKFNDFYKS